MKTANQVAREVAAKVAEHGSLKFMGNKSYTSREFWAEIAERAILADRAQRNKVKQINALSEDSKNMLESIMANPAPSWQGRKHIDSASHVVSSQAGLASMRGIA